VPTARKPRCLLLATSLAKLQSRSTTVLRSASADKAEVAAAAGAGAARALVVGGAIGCRTTTAGAALRRGDRTTCIMLH
jgi:hypothetical protein